MISTDPEKSDDIPSQWLRKAFLRFTLTRSGTQVDDIFVEKHVILLMEENSASTS